MNTIKNILIVSSLVLVASTFSGCSKKSKIHIPTQAIIKAIK